MRKGVVTAAAPLAVAVGGSATPYTDIVSVGGTPLAVGDPVSVVMYGGTLLVLGVIGVQTTFFAQVDTQENTISPAYVDLATDGPSLTLPAGNYVLSGGAGTYVSLGVAVSFVGIFAGGVLQRQMQTNFSGVSQIEHPSSATAVLAVTAGTVVKLRYGSYSAGTAEFFNRWIRADRI